MTSQIRNTIRRQMMRISPMTRDIVLGMLAGGLAVTGWSFLPKDQTAPAVASAGAAFATGAPVAASSVLPAPTGAPLLWKVSSGSATVYLFGSIHYLPAGTTWMDKRLFQAFDSADAAWFEVPDLDALPHFKGLPQKVTASRPVLTQGLTETEKQQLSLILNRYNTTLEASSHVLPGVMAQQITALDVDGSTASIDTGVDLTLFHRAKALKHTTGGFEDNRLHYSYLYALKDDHTDGTVALKRALAAHFGTGDTGSSLLAAAKAWRTGDEATLTADMLADKARDPQMYQTLLVKRNTLWVPKIEDMLKGKQTVFVVAGADHFIGPDSVVAQLRGKGYTVERVEE